MCVRVCVFVCVRAIKALPDITLKAPVHSFCDVNISAEIVASE